MIERTQEEREERYRISRWLRLEHRGFQIGREYDARAELASSQEEREAASLWYRAQMGELYARMDELKRTEREERRRESIQEEIANNLAILNELRRH